MSTDHLFAVVMAGGSGTRFWPLSRRRKPKQFLELAEPGRTLLASTVERVRPLVPMERVLVVTGAHLAEATRRALPDLPPANVLAEPVAKNTAPCVAWAAFHALNRDPEAVLAVLAADHFVADRAAYLEVVRRALSAASDGSLVTVGIRPSRAETGYGYLEVGGQVGPGFSHDVLRFVEKPDAERALEFVRSGRFLWNSGQFFFRADAFLRALERHLPEVHAAFIPLANSATAPEGDATVRTAYEACPAISIDHGVMEKAEGVRVVPGDFGWSDVGSWTTAWELADKDPRGNAAVGDAALVDCDGCYVCSPNGKLIALLGMRDVVVVDTPDALLVLPRSRAQDVRAVVAEVERRRKDLL